MLFVILWFAVSDYPFGFWLPLWFLIIPLVTDYLFGFWLPLWFLITPLVSDYPFGFWLPVWFLIIPLISDYPFGFFKLFLHVNVISYKHVVSLLYMYVAFHIPSSKIWFLCSASKKQFNTCKLILLLFFIICKFLFPSKFMHSLIHFSQATSCTHTYKKKYQKFNGKYTIHLSDLDENVYNVFNCDSNETQQILDIKT